MKVNFRGCIIVLLLAALILVMLSSAVSAAPTPIYIYYYNQNDVLVRVSYLDIVSDLTRANGALRDALQEKLAAAYNNERLFFIEFDDNRVINYYKAVFDMVNYYPDAYEDPDYWWFSPLSPTLQLVLVDGIAVEVPIGPTALLEAVRVGAINNETFQFEVEFDEASAAYLTGKSITLYFGRVVAQANYTSLTGKVATFTVRTEDRAAMISGDYSLVASWLAPTALTASYNQVIADSGVLGFVYNVDSNAYMSDVEIKILDGSQTLTATDGHYLIPSIAGERHVSLRLDDYFTVRREIPVQRNYFSVSNINMQRIDITKLEILGTVIDQDTSVPVAGARVILQRKVDSSWPSLATVTSDGSGNFAFGNWNSTVTGFGVSSHRFSTNGSGPINMTDQFRVVAEKSLSSFNLDNVYAQKEQEIDISDEQPATNVLVMLRPIAKINSIKFGLTWNPEARGANDGEITNIRVTMLDRDGTEVLRAPLVFGPSVIGAPVRTVYADHMDLFSDKMLDLVKAETWDGVAANYFGTVPTLPTGTYYLLVDNFTSPAASVYAANARTIVPLSITEGTDYENLTAATVMLSRTVRLKTDVDNIYFANSLAANPSANITFGGGVNDGITGNLTLVNTDETVSTFAPLPVRLGTFVTTDYEIYSSVNGTAVRYYSAAELGTDQKFIVNRGANTSINDFTVSEVTDFINLAAGDYTVYSINSPYVRGTKQRTITAGAAIATPTMSVSSSSSLSKLRLAASGNPIANSTGNVTVELRRGGIVRYSATGLSTNGSGEVFLGGAFTELEPNENYTLRILVDGYKPFTSAAFNVMDFAELKGTFTLIPEDAVALTGYIRFAGTMQTVSQTSEVDATVTAYRYNSVTDRWVYVGYADLAALVGTATYSFSPGVLTNGVPYKLVVRGRGFETVERDGVLLVRGNNAQNFVVEPNRGAGKFRFNIVDSLERPLVLGNVNAIDGSSDVLLRDAWAYDISSNYAPVVGHPVGSRGVFDGRYPMHGVPIAPSPVVFHSTAVVTGVNAKTGDLLSKGTYTLSIAGTLQTNPYTAMVTIPEYNDTIYRNIYVPVIAGALDVNIVLTVTRTPALIALTANPHASDYVKVYNSDGDLVRTARLDYVGLSSTGNILVPINDIYRVVVYADESYLAETTVSVQDFNQPVTIAVDKAVR